MSVEFMKERIIKMLNEVCTERIEFIYWFLQKTMSKIK